MIWSAVPDYAARDGLFPDQEATGPLYSKLLFLLTVNTEEVDHDKVVQLLTRIKASLLPKYQTLMLWVQKIINDLNIPMG